MPTEVTDNAIATTIDIHNDAVKLLELLNVLIPKVDKFNVKLPPNLMREIADICFSLGANLSIADELEDKSDDK